MVAKLVALRASSNERACTIRLLNKDFREELKEECTVRLCQPVPAHAFSHRYRHRPEPWSIELELLLTCSVALSGHVENMQLLLESSPPGFRVMEDAATSDAAHNAVAAAAHYGGRPEMREYLERRGYGVWPTEALCAAARSNFPDLCRWLLNVLGTEAWDNAAPGAAAMGGHVQLMDQLLTWRQQHPCPYDPSLLGKGELLRGAAYGCDLRTLQRLHGLVQQQPFGMMAHELWYTMTGAAASTTADWQAKLTWLLEQGFPRCEQAMRAAMGLRCPSGGLRLKWLVQQAYQMDAIPAGELNSLMTHAAACGLLPEVRFIISQWSGPRDPPDERMPGYVETALCAGHVKIAEVLLKHRFPDVRRSELPSVAQAAAEAGHIEAVEWLVRRFGRAAVDGTTDDSDDGGQPDSSAAVVRGSGGSTGSGRRRRHLLLATCATAASAALAVAAAMCVRRLCRRSHR
ncbi:hypothetical protein HYH02_008441 [Chlamydomonas schloesseri]|uniref:Uncharacterized protein n=1 Tax=Chlamydomonas schloesseri TaxID=2026947 RepID=A0A835WFS1_9CHLO|nr:hypothetical protein HYH02_008441 [Chlamydomonas schloesseri]|eukprot:KAG2446449.1 hypothetical protein HYH02_008441 [Chlamydomonas schloesseri]